MGEGGEGLVLVNENPLNLEIHSASRGNDFIAHSFQKGTAMILHGPSQEKNIKIGLSASAALSQLPHDLDLNSEDPRYEETQKRIVDDAYHQIRSVLKKTAEVGASYDYDTESVIPTACSVVKIVKAHGQNLAIIGFTQESAAYLFKVGRLEKIDASTPSIYNAVQPSDNIKVVALDWMDAVLLAASDVPYTTQQLQDTLYQNGDMPKLLDTLTQKKTDVSASVVVIEQKTGVFKKLLQDLKSKSPYDPRVLDEIRELNINDLSIGQMRKIVRMHAEALEKRGGESRGGIVNPGLAEGAQARIDILRDKIDQADLDPDSLPAFSRLDLKTGNVKSDIRHQNKITGAVNELLGKGLSGAALQEAAGAYMMAHKEPPAVSPEDRDDFLYTVATGGVSEEFLLDTACHVWASFGQLKLMQGERDPEKLREATEKILGEIMPHKSKTGRYTEEANVVKVKKIMSQAIKYIGTENGTFRVVPTWESVVAIWKDYPYPEDFAQQAAKFDFRALFQQSGAEVNGKILPVSETDVKIAIATLGYILYGKQWEYFEQIQVLRQEAHTWWEQAKKPPDSPPEKPPRKVWWGFGRPRKK